MVRSEKFFRYAPLIILISIVLAPHDHTLAQEPEWRALLERLRSDGIPGNATRALRKLQLIARTSPPTEFLEQLRGLADDPDPQMSQYASFLLATAHPEILLRDSKMRTRFIEALSDDDLPFSASQSWGTIGRLIREENPASLRDQLLNVLSNSDHQARQMAAYLLVLSYREAGIPESQWPEAVFANMIQGLRDDPLRGKKLIANAVGFFNILFKLNEGQPVDILTRELAGQDPQSQFAAAILLAHYRHDPALPEIATRLAPYLIDEPYFPAIPAYQAIVWTGPESTAKLLRNFEPTDAQQAALLICAGAFHGLSSSFTTDAHLRKWVRKVEQSETSTGPYKSADVKIAMAALYLDPGAKAFLNGKELPPALIRMFNAGAGVQALTDRAKWMATWFPMLDPYAPEQANAHPYRAASAIISGRAEYAPSN